MPSRREFLRLGVGTLAAAGAYALGYNQGTQRPAEITHVPQSPSLPKIATDCTPLQPGEGILHALSRTSGRGSERAVSVTSNASGNVTIYSLDELQTKSVVVYPGDTVCSVESSRKPTTQAAIRTPERVGERRTQNPTVFDQRKFAGGQDMCGPTTLASILSTYGISGHTPDATKNELQRLGIYTPGIGTDIRNGTKPDDVLRWLQRRHRFEVREVVEIQRKGGAPTLNQDDLQILKRLCEQDYALITSGMIPEPEIGRADHILWINDTNYQKGEVKVIDPWNGKHEWRNARTTFDPLWYIYAVKPS